MAENPGQVLLSQDEIDALLGMLPDDGQPLSIEPEVVSPQVTHRSETIRLYDFRQPDQFNKERLRTLRMIHENLARRLTLQLSAKLRTAIDVTLVHIETGPYATFVQQLPSPTAVNLISLRPLPGRIFLQYDNVLVDMLIDRLLGGTGVPTGQQGREMTELELDLLSGITMDVLESVEDAWRSTIVLESRLDETVTNPYFVQIALPTEICAWISLDVRFRNHSATLNACIPASVLKPISQKLNPQAWISESAKESDQEESRAFSQQKLKVHLGRLAVDLQAVLMGGDLQLSELLNLQVGDVIPLQRHIGDEAVLMMQEQAKFFGHVGTFRGKYAVQIARSTDGPEQGQEA